MFQQTWQIVPILGVPNVRAAAEYYRDVLGFELDPERGIFQPGADEPGGVYAFVRRGGAWIHLQIRRVEIPERRRESIERDVYIYVDDLDALYADLDKRGAPLKGPIQTAPYGMREIDIVDLNGYRITFGQDLP